MLKKIKDRMLGLRNGKPGERFVEHHQRHKAESENEPRWKKIAIFGLAGVLLIGAVALSAVPGIPGVALAFPALGLLVQRVKIIAVWLDRAELFARRTLQKLH